MAYIGSVPTTAAFPFDQFSGTGSQTVFTLSQAPASTTSIAVAVSGVTQNPNTYSVSGTTLTFTGAPPSGTNNIGVLFLGLPTLIGVPSAATVGLTQLSATGTPSATNFHRGDNTWAGVDALTTASGSAPSYSARAWVNFNGTGTVAIRASGNVSSITDNGTGDYTVNFTVAMSDTNYSAIATTSNASGIAGNGAVAMFSTSVTTQQAPTTSAFRFVTPRYNWVAQDDMQYVCVAVFR